ncbi:glycosyltransferase family 4 protein [Marinobacter hydrocarbonoclasticus]|nr:glycosyltransferase family 4 protein [Marinobacter nauticus]
MKKRIICIGTSSPGGIRSVIENYENDGIYSEYEYEYISSHDNGSRSANAIRFIGFIIEYAYKLARYRPIVHAHASMRGSFFRKSICFWIAKLVGAKFVYHLHGSEFKVFYNSLNPLLQKYVKATFNRCDRFIVLSDSWKEYIESICHANVEVVENYVDDKKVVPKSIEVDSEDRPINLLFLGNIGDRKGIFDLIDSLHKFKSVGGRFLLNVGGDGNIEKLKSVIEKRGLEDDVKYLGWINSDDKYRLLSNSDALILPSYNEGLPMVILEAMSAQTLVISCPVGGIPDAITSGFNGILVKPGDIEALTDALIFVRDSPEDVKKYTRNARTTYEERFALDKANRKINEIYSKL